MPIYEYQCSKCGHEVEVIQKMSDNPLTECPSCHQSALTKLVSASGFQLKGTGWYVTDYSTKGKAKNAESTEKKESKTETQVTDSGSNDKSSGDKGASS